jgi:excinuclease ABC subunit B
MAILYADKMTDSMRTAIDETNRRRSIQVDYNEENGITPESIIKPVDMELVAVSEADYVTSPIDGPDDDEIDDDVGKLGERIEQLEADMREAARRFEFERAAELRDRAKVLRARRLEIA